ncbi:polysaccharide pyruvyl transferase family protein [Amphritea balenae]|nr:polysaccharide pyruvyl transferase family protein [Amphritea balenae]
MDNLHKLLHDNDMSVAWSWPVHKDWRLHKDEILAFPEVDLVIVNGEGTINNSGRKKYAQALMEFAAFSNQYISENCYLINSTLFNNTDESYDLLKAYRGIYVRDRASLAELADRDIVGTYVPDLTFYEAVPYRAVESHKSSICVTDNTVKPMASRLKKYANTKGYRYVTMMLAHPRNKPFWKSPRTYVKNCWKWWFEDRNRSTEPQAYIDTLREYELIVTGRFHTVTMCIKNRIPFAAIASNTPKIENLLGDILGESSRVVTIKDIESDNYPEKWPFTPIEQEKIDQFMLRANVGIEKMICSVKLDTTREDVKAPFQYL